MQTMGKKKKSKGPPNRVNDLNYSDWMKFQKSFFIIESNEKTPIDFIYFFTKSAYEGRESKILTIENNISDVSTEFNKRNITQKTYNNIEDIFNIFNDEEKLYDFIYINISNAINNSFEYDEFIKKTHLLSKLISLRLRESMYCTIVCNNYDGDNFPVPWGISLGLRKELRLKDEKIGIPKEYNRIENKYIKNIGYSFNECYYLIFHISFRNSLIQIFWI